MGEDEQWGWQRIPSELRQRILRLLPLRAALSCRAVSREWKELLASWSARSSSSWFLVKQEQQLQGGLEWAMIDAGSGELIRLERNGCSEARSVAVGDGLVCFSTRSSSGPEFYVGNPLFQGSWRKLPELPRSTGTIAMLVVNALVTTRVLGIVRMDEEQNSSKKKKQSGSCSWSFKVLVGRGSCGSILLYESNSNAWREVSSSEAPAPDLVQQMLQEMDEHENVVPLRIRRRKFELLWPSLQAGRNLIGFDFAKVTWVVVEAPIPEQLDAVSLVEEHSSGCILLVGATKSSRGSHHYRHLKVWRLREGSREWEMVSRMRDHMLQEVSPKGLFCACCAAAGGGVILLACTLEKFSAQLRDWAFKRLLVWFYDTHNGKWSSNPCRRLLKDLDLATTVVYPFQPRLDFH